MKPINDVIQGPESTFKKRVYDAILETGKQSLIRNFENNFDNLDLEDQIALSVNLLKRSPLFY